MATPTTQRAICYFTSLVAPFSPSLLLYSALRSVSCGYILESSSDTPAATPAHVRTSPTVNMGVLQRSMMANGSSPTLVALNCTVLDPRSACHKCLAVICNYIAYLCRYGFSSAIGIATLAFSAEHTQGERKKSEGLIKKSE